MHFTSDENDFLIRRSCWLQVSFAAIAIAVMTFSAQRLNQKLDDTHLSTDRDHSVTHNPYQGAAGTIFSASGEALALNRADTQNDRYRSNPTTLLMRDVTGSGMLADALEPALRRGLTDFVRSTPDRANKVGRNLRLTLHARLQALMQRDAQCFTGGDCQHLPASLLKADSRFKDTTHGPRAGMASAVLVEEDSGEVIAMSGAIADCVQTNLRRKVDPKSPRARQVFANDTDFCPQYPDAAQADLLGHRMSRGIYLNQLVPGVPLDTEAGLGLHPALWPMPPGSVAKIELAIACAKSRLFYEGTSAVREKFAVSADNDWFKALALRCSDAYRDVFLHYSEPTTLLWPAALLIRPSEFPGWSMRPQPSVLPAGPVMTPQDFLALEGSSVKRYKHRPSLAAGQFKILQRSRDLASIAIGGGDHNSYLISHVRILRDLGLSSRGVLSAPALHLARDIDEQSLTEDLSWMPRAQESKEVLEILSGVTAGQGTANLACIRVNGGCPRDGLTVSGKTGTTDLTDKPHSSVLKRGGAPLPAKLFVGRFEANGKWYVVAAHAFRTRDPRTRALDESNPAAELALLARRHLMEFETVKESPKAAPTPSD